MVGKYVSGVSNECNGNFNCDDEMLQVQFHTYTVCESFVCFSCPIPTCIHDSKAASVKASLSGGQCSCILAVKYIGSHCVTE